MKSFLNKFGRAFWVIVILAVSFQPVQADNPAFDTLNATSPMIYSNYDGSISQNFQLSGLDTTLYEVDINMFSDSGGGDLGGNVEVHLYNADVFGDPTTPIMQLGDTITTLPADTTNIVYIRGLNVSLSAGNYAIVVKIFNIGGTVGFNYVDCPSSCPNSIYPNNLIFGTFLDTEATQESYLFVNSALQMKIYAGDPTPVTTMGLDVNAATGGQDWMARWETASEVNTVGFNLYTSYAADAPMTPLNAELIPAKTPGSVIGNLYEFNLGPAPMGSTFWLAAVDVNGQETMLAPAYPLYRYYMPATIRR